MKEKKVDVQVKYQEELRKIECILKDLEELRIYERTSVKMHGSLPTKANQLRELIKDLINKVEYDQDSDADLVDDLF